SEGDRKKFETDLKKVEDSGSETVAAAFREFLKEFEKALEKKLTDDDSRDIRSIADDKFVASYAENFLGKFETLEIKSPQKKSECKKVIKEFWGSVEEAIDARDR